MDDEVTLGVRHKGKRTSVKVGKLQWTAPLESTALVLEAHTDHLVVFYVSDGLIPDDDEEAWSLGEVPITHAVRASENVVRRCVA